MDMAMANGSPGALPPLASVTIVRVLNFSVYNSARTTFTQLAARAHGRTPDQTYNDTANTPLSVTLSTSAAAGMVGGFLSAPIACQCFPPR